MSDESEILRLVAEYCHAVDEHGGVGLAELFTADGSFSMRGTTSNGRDDIRARVTGEDRANGLVHLAANPIINVDGDEAHGTVDHLLLRRQDDGSLAVFAAGRWRDRYVRDEGRWLIAERAVEFPYGFPAPPH